MIRGLLSAVCLLQTAHCTIHNKRLYVIAAEYYVLHVTTQLLLSLNDLVTAVSGGQVFALKSFLILELGH